MNLRVIGIERFAKGGLLEDPEKGESVGLLIDASPEQTEAIRIALASSRAVFVTVDASPPTSMFEPVFYNRIGFLATPELLHPRWSPSETGCPIFRPQGMPQGWYFWNQERTGFHGPYATEAGAHCGVTQYRANLVEAEVVAANPVRDEEKP